MDAYIISLFSEQIGKGAMAYYLNRRDNVPGWEVASVMLFIMFGEVFYLLVWATELFVKHPQDSAVSIAWHRDCTYMGFAPHTTITAWIALADSTTANGCMRAVPGPQRRSAAVRRARGAFGWALKPRAATAVVLAAVLAAAIAVTPSFAGHSLGGPLALDYARRYSGEVGGIVLLDSMHPQQTNVFAHADPLPNAALPQ